MAELKRTIRDHEVSGVPVTVSIMIIAPVGETLESVRALVDNAVKEAVRDASGDLSEIEVEAVTMSVSETAGDLEKELTDWCEERGIEPQSADELAVSNLDLDRSERLYLARFIERWDLAMADDAERAKASINPLLRDFIGGSSDVTGVDNCPSCAPNEWPNGANIGPYSCRSCGARGGA